MSESIRKSLLGYKSKIFMSSHSSIILHEDKIANLTQADEHASAIFRNITIGTLKLTLSICLQTLTYSIYLIFLQGESPTVQGAASLAISLMNVFGSAIFAGLNFGLMNRLSHVYGAKNYKLMGLYLHRGLIINLIFVLACATLVYFVPTIFRNIGYNVDLLDNMQEFTSIAIVAFPFYSLWQVYSNYLSAHGNFHTPSYIQIFSCCVCIGAAYLFILKWELGIHGAAYAYIIQQLLNASIVVLYCYCANPVKGSLFWFERDSFKGIWDLLIYKVKAGGQAFFDWVGFEIMILLSGTLTVSQCDAFVLVLNFYFLMAGVAVAASITASSYVGSLMGAKQVKTAKLYAQASILFIVIYSVLMMGIFYFLSPQIAELYSDSDDTENYMINLMKVFVIMTPLDNIQYTMAGVLRSIKLESKAVVIIFVNMYLIGIPSAFGLVFFTSFEIYGIAASLIVVVLLNMIGFVYLAVSSDWHKLAELISQVLSEDAGDLDESSNKKIMDSDIRANLTNQTV